MFPRLLGAAVFGLVLAPHVSHAQTLALSQFDPAPAGDSFYGVPSSQTNGHLVPRGILLFDYAHRPLVATIDNGGSVTNQGGVVSAQAFLHFGASLALWNRVLVSASFPLAVMQQGESPTVQGTVFPSPTGIQAGDLRLGARVRLFGENHEAFQIAAGFSLHTPTAPNNSFTGDGGVRVCPELLFSGRSSRILWSATVRPVFSSSDNPSKVSYGAGIALSLLEDRLRIGPEFFASTPLQDGIIRFGQTKTISRGLQTNAEVWLGIRGNVTRGFWIGAAGGPGLSDAIGTPTFRAMGLVAWAPEGQTSTAAQSNIADTDEDGLSDNVDQCPYTYAEKNDLAARPGCPVIDTDEDGIADPDDVCPEEPGTANEPNRRGCPADRDGDGVPDAIDVCPDVKGETQRHGCVGG